MSRHPAMPLTRRFHRRPGDRLRYWERAVLLGLCAREPERRLWANVLSDALYIVYRSRHRADVQRELAWIMATTRGSLQHFEDLAEVFDIEADDLRRDVRRDIESGRIRAKRITC